MFQHLKDVVRNSRAQIVLPAVMLAPIFILVVYLLFETSKLSMTKVRQQFALDNGAYSQMSTTSGYLNALAMVNGPLPYRVIKTFDAQLTHKQKKTAQRKGVVTVFDVFYEAGAFPAAGPSHESGPNGAINNPVPAAESNNWDFQYFNGKRKNWMKEDPTMKLEEDEEEDGHVVLTDKSITEDYFFDASSGGLGLEFLQQYLLVFIRTGSIYASQDYVYKDNIKNSRMFRESYFLNTRECSRRECGKQAAETLDRYELESKAMELDKIALYFTATMGKFTASSNSLLIPLNTEEIMKSKLFQFAYLTPTSRSRLRQLDKGIVLKQKFAVPANRFNIDLTQRYKPYVRNTVSISCPRSGNNCVWPNPLPKYSVKVGI